MPTQEDPPPLQLISRRATSDLRRATARGVILNGIFDVGLLAVTGLRGIIVALFLTKYAYGVWGLLGLTLWASSGLKNQFGAGDKYVQQKERDQVLAFQKAMAVEVVFTALVSPVCVAVPLIFALCTGKTVVIAPGLSLLLVLPAIVLQFPLSVFYRQMDYGRQRLIQSIDPLTTAVVTIALAAVGAGYWSFVGGVLCGTWSGAIIALRLCPYPVRLHWEAGMLRSYLTFSVPLLIAGLLGIATFQTIYFVGGSALGLAGLGTLALVSNFVQFVDQADATITQTIYPAICAVQDRGELLVEIFVKSNRLSLMWAVPFGVGLSLFSKDLFVYVMGTRWLPAVPLMEILGVTAAINHVGYNWTAFFQARGTTREIAVAAFVSVVPFLALAIPLMYDDGVIGYGWAVASGELATLAVRFYLVNRFFTGFEPLRHLTRALLPSVCAVAPVLLIRLVFGSEGSLAAAVGLAFLYFLTTCLMTFLFERELLGEALGYLRRSRDFAAARLA